jgi:hypothetical protein
VWSFLGVEGWAGVMRCVLLIIISGVETVSIAFSDNIIDYNDDEGIRQEEVLRVIVIAGRIEK